MIDRYIKLSLPLFYLISLRLGTCGQKEKKKNCYIKILFFFVGNFFSLLMQTGDGLEEGDDAVDRAEQVGPEDATQQQIFMAVAIGTRCSVNFVLPRFLSQASPLRHQCSIFIIFPPATFLEQ